MNRGAVNRVLVARGLRAFADGYVSLLLPLYLLELGLGPLQVGIIATATLLGSGVMTLLVGLHAHRFHARAMLLAATLVMAATGVGFAMTTAFWPLVIIAFVGTLNPSSGDVSVFLPLEHSALTTVVTDRERTAVFARYSVAGSLCAAVGSLAVALPGMLESAAGVSRLGAMQSMFVLYALLALFAAVAYRGLPRSLESTTHGPAQPLTKSKRTVYLLAALFSLDAFGGGLVVQSMLALWLFQHFDLSIAAAGTIFFWTGLLTTVSYLLAVRIANRIGLVNTMVFTHLPSNVLLILVPLMPNLPLAIFVLLLRFSLSQMDVPTRQSYVMAVVEPGERSAAAGVTGIAKTTGAAISPAISAPLVASAAFTAVPFLLAGGLKIVYDLLLWRAFSARPVPEERRS